MGCRVPGLMNLVHSLPPRVSFEAGAVARLAS